MCVSLSVCGSCDCIKYMCVGSRQGCTLMCPRECICVRMHEFVCGVNMSVFVSVRVSVSVCAQRVCVP